MNVVITKMEDLLFWYKGTVGRVIDGDSVVFSELDLGFSIALKKRHGRLLGIDAPELRTKDVEVKFQANLSKEYLAQRLTGQEVVIKSQKVDSFGRILCDIYLQDEFINNTLLAEKFAVEFQG